ncbi:MAG TPA: lasso peptide biosynthesis B2 protein [Thermoanaerobaculia bacterium]|nr:lasso peptide biosynthesis B2 protein [Thermoanaerobaculia bacterium]
MSTSARPANLLHAIFEVAVAAVSLVVADAMVRLVPFGVIARRIETQLRRDPSPQPAAATRRVQWAIDAAHRRVPWTVKCLATALAANRLLAWRGVASELWLGVRTNERKSMDAHAWLIAEGCVVTGRAEKNTYQPLRAFVTATRS